MPTATTPSWHDFAAIDLPDIVERFAAEWDDLPPLHYGHPGYRQIIGVGRLGVTYFVIGQLAPGGAIELVDIDIDLEGLPGVDDAN